MLDLKKFFVDVGLRQYHLDIALAPLLSRQFLHESHQVVSFEAQDGLAELLDDGDEQEYHEGRVFLLVGDVGVEEAYPHERGEHAQEHSRDVAEGQIEEIYFLFLEVVEQLLIDLLKQFLDLRVGLVESSEPSRIIFYHILQHLGSAPVEISLNRHQGVLPQDLHTHLKLHLFRVHWKVL